MAWAPSYAATSETRNRERISDVADDALLALAIAASSRAIDDECHRQFGLVDAPEARLYTAVWDRKLCRWVVRIDDLMTTTGMAVAVDRSDDGQFADAIAGSALQLEPLNAAAEGRPWEQITVRAGSSVQPTGQLGAVRITARWGWTAVPQSIKQATMQQVGRLNARRDAPFGVAGSPEAGSEIRLLARLDPDVLTTVKPYRRVWGAV